MNLKELRARGAFVQAPPVPEECSWTHEDSQTGEMVTDVFTVFVKRMSVGWLDRVYVIDRNDPERSRTAALIAGGILFDDGVGGHERLKYEEAYQLDFGLAAVLLGAFNRVNKSQTKKQTTTPANGEAAGEEDDDEEEDRVKN